MRARKLGLLSSTVLLALALECTPALATKPSQPPGKAKVEERKSAKVDARGGQQRQESSPNRAGFAAGNVRSRDDRDDRDDDRHDGRDYDRNDSRNDGHDRNEWHDRDDDHHHDDGHNDWHGNDNWHHDDRDDRDDRWRHDGDDWRRDDRNGFYSYSRDYDRRDYDRRYYDHDYYRRGYVVPRLPVGYRVVRYYDVPYYFGGGAWYRPYGSNFTIVSPPLGLMVSFLPDVYTTLWLGGIPYYRANDVYYRWHPQHRAYIVTALPIG